MRNKILIYCDYGTSNIDPLTETLGNHFKDSKDIQIELTDAQSIIKEDALNEDVLAFVIGGGASTPYTMKLKYYGHDKIREYVKNGGTYLGICAGAYYGCNSIDFEKDIPEIAKASSDTLDFVVSRAKGTLHKELGIAPYSMTADSATITRIEWLADKEEHASYYHGGPFFDEINDADTDILATYKEIDGNPPAVIMKKYGKGRAILSGVHFERTGAQLFKHIYKMQIDNEQAIKNAAVLIENEPSRKALTDKMMSVLSKGRN